MKIEELKTLLDALPGKVSNEILMDWPCDGQASLVWFDVPHAEIVAHDLHHFEGMDFKVIHDEGETDSPIWKLLARALDTAALAITQAEQLERLRVLAEGWIAKKDEWMTGESSERWSTGITLVECAKELEAALRGEV